MLHMPQRWPKTVAIFPAWVLVVMINHSTRECLPCDPLDPKGCLPMDLAPVTNKIEIHFAKFSTQGDLQGTLDRLRIHMPLHLNYGWYASPTSEDMYLLQRFSNIAVMVRHQRTLRQKLNGTLGLQVMEERWFSHRCPNEMLRIAISSEDTPLMCHNLVAGFERDEADMGLVENHIQISTFKADAVWASLLTKVQHVMKEEPSTLNYNAYFLKDSNGGSGTVHLFERYANISALMRHMEIFGAFKGRQARHLGVVQFMGVTYLSPACNGSLVWENFFLRCTGTLVLGY